MTHDPTLFEKYHALASAEQLHCRFCREKFWTGVARLLHERECPRKRDAQRCPPDPMARESVRRINVILNQLSANDVAHMLTVFPVREGERNRAEGL